MSNLIALCTVVMIASVGSKVAGVTLVDFANVILQAAHWAVG